MKTIKNSVSLLECIERQVLKSLQKKIRKFSDWSLLHYMYVCIYITAKKKKKLHCSLNEKKTIANRIILSLSRKSNKRYINNIFQF